MDKVLSNVFPGFKSSCKSDKSLLYVFVHLGIAGFIRELAVKSCKIYAAQIDALPTINSRLQKNRPNDKCPLNRFCREE